MDVLVYTIEYHGDNMEFLFYKNFDFDNYSKKLIVKNERNLNYYTSSYDGKYIILRNYYEEKIYIYQIYPEMILINEFSNISHNDLLVVQKNTYNLIHVKKNIIFIYNLFNKKDYEYNFNIKDEILNILNKNDLIVLNTMEKCYIINIDTNEIVKEIILEKNSNINYIITDEKIFIQFNNKIYIYNNDYENEYNLLTVIDRSEQIKNFNIIKNDNYLIIMEGEIGLRQDINIIFYNLNNFSIEYEYIIETNYYYGDFYDLYK